jgi:hypothetical protein
MIIFLVIIFITLVLSRDEFYELKESIFVLKSSKHTDPNKPVETLPNGVVTRSTPKNTFHLNTVVNNLTKQKVVSISYVSTNSTKHMKDLNETILTGGETGVSLNNSTYTIIIAVVGIFGVLGLTSMFFVMFKLYDKYTTRYNYETINGSDYSL